MTTEIPRRIRQLRHQQKRTLKEIALVCGFTESLLSKIESGKSSPPVATLARIAAALGVGLSDLMDGSQAVTTVFTSADALAQRPVTRTAKGYGFQVLAAERAGKLMQPFHFIAEKGSVKPGRLAHSGEEFVYVLEGRMHYRVGPTTYTLGPGDSLYFNAEEEHDLEPITDVVQFLGVFTERGAVSALPAQMKEKSHESNATS